MDFNILHLSDLHVKDTIQLQPNLEKLLSDISEQIKNIREIIVVVTGDIVDKGIYNINSEKNVIDFFEQLKTVLNVKFQSILIVPGNHDRVQCSTSNIIIEHLRENSGLINCITAEDWNYHLLSYQKFLDLEDKIYNIFYPDSIVPLHHEQTFGVEKYINNESVIIFIKLDTAWCSLGGEKDKRKLHVSNYQLEYLKNEYQKLRNEEKGKNILTIAICHHPIKWLTEAEEDFLYSYFISEDYLNVDIVLCGHVHDIEINNMYNSFRQITTLLTGIGWKENLPTDKKNGHRYSIYVFNLRRNSCEAVVRKTDLTGNFDIDRDFLPDKHSKSVGRLSIPIILRNNYPYIEIPTFDDNELKYIPLFIDKKILTDIKKYTWALSQLLSCMKEDLITYKQNVLEDFTYPVSKIKAAKESIRKYFDSGMITTEVNKILSSAENQELIYTYFKTYLFEICNQFVDLFKCFYNSKSTDDIRIFFRYFDCKHKKYVQICQQSKSNIMGQAKTTNNARDIDYGGLIEKAYKVKTPLVFSSNMWYNSLKPTKWDNFITIVPIFDNYEYSIEGNKYPVITCAISIKSTVKDPFLDILNYINIQGILNDIITEYLNTFQVKITDCVAAYFQEKEGQR